jgi:hypothetical protein
MQETWKIEEACLWYLAHELGIIGFEKSVSISENERD